MLRVAEKRIVEFQPTALRSDRYILSFALVVVVTITLSRADETDRLVELEEFIAEETLLEETETLLPTEREVNSVYGSARSLLETPRSISVINPETLKEHDLDDVNELAERVAGATIVNFYGIAGIPHTRGLYTSNYFNGMQRVWNRNGYPTSFGSLESLDYVKGPTPALYSASSPGGYVNFVPKSPYFDEFRGSIKFTYGSYDHLNTQLDIGGPTLLSRNPSAWRISLTYQNSDTYYDRLVNDYLSAYAAAKIKLSDKISFFLGGEYYLYRGDERVGWNRVTQDLIDNGIYIVGNPLNDLTGEVIEMPSAFGGTQTVTNQTPGRASREAIESTAPFGGILGNFNRRTKFNPNDLSQDAVEFFAFVGGLRNCGNPFFYQMPESGCTSNSVETVRISGKQNLSNPDDFADTNNILFFWDTLLSGSDQVAITNKVYFESYSRSKYSTYGYAEEGENSTIENKTIVEHAMPNKPIVDSLIYGTSIRFEDALAKTDFTAEPFSRRDITKPENLNTILPAGGDRNRDGLTFWDPFGSNQTKMITYGVFLTADLEPTERINLILNGRFDHAHWFDRKRPDDISYNPFTPKPGDVIGSQHGRGDGRGGKSYFNWSVSGVRNFTDTLSGYVSYHRGTSFQGYYVSGGIANSQGDTNFMENALAEMGVKVVSQELNLYGSFNVYHIDLEEFDDRGGFATDQRGRGIECDFAWEPNDWLSLSAALSWQEHFFRTRKLVGGFVPLNPYQMVMYAGATYLDFGLQEWRGKDGIAGDGPRHSIPQWTGNFYIRIRTRNGITVGIGPVFTDSQFLNADRTVSLPSSLVWNGRVSYSTDDWELALSGTNLFGEDHFFPSDSFASNAIVTKAPGAEWKATVTYQF